MRKLTREQLINKLKKAYPNMMLRTTEEFNNNKGGIWTSGEESPLDRHGLPLFDYWVVDSSEEKYIFGVRRHFHDFLERNGWFCEWYDAGTMMIWED